MLMFTLAISCLTASNLPWFMDLTFQVPMQYCSLQHWTLLLSPVPPTAGCYFCFGSIPSFFSPVAYWAPTNLGSSSFNVLSFCLFILFMRFSRQENWSGLPFPSPVNHIVTGSSVFSKCSLNIWKFLVHVLLKPCLENLEHYFASMWDECSWAVVCILWHCLSLGLEWKLIFSSPVATTEFSKFSGILSAALSQHHLLGLETAQLDFRLQGAWL